MKSEKKVHLTAFVSGSLFGIGLAVSQMVNPNKILAFLDVAGNWDPSLILVMFAATGLTLVMFRWVLKKPQPLFSTSFSLPTRQDVDYRLIAGACFFGIGWGLAGYCPGPAIAALATWGWEPIVFISSIVVGALSHKIFFKN